MTTRYWLEMPNGGRQLIDPDQFDMDDVSERARKMGGRLVAERLAPSPPRPDPGAPRPFEPPITALGPLFRNRLARVYSCRADFDIDMNSRSTVRVLGGYYKKRRLIRVYTHDRKTGRRSLEELFDTFLHEVAHHLEYTEPDSYAGAACGRVPGRMHSRLFWRILGDLKARWAELHHPGVKVSAVDLALQLERESSDRD